MTLPFSLMEITRTELLERLEMLKKQADMFRQQYNITMGAITDCEYWLKQLEAQESETNNG